MFYILRERVQEDLLIFGWNFTILVIVSALVAVCLRARFFRQMHAACVCASTRRDVRLAAVAATVAAVAVAAAVAAAAAAAAFEKKEA